MDSFNPETTAKSPRRFKFYGIALSIAVVIIGGVYVASQDSARASLLGSISDIFKNRVDIPDGYRLVATLPAENTQSTATTALPAKNISSKTVAKKSLPPAVQSHASEKNIATSPTVQPAPVVPDNSATTQDSTVQTPAPTEQTTYTPPASALQAEVPASTANTQNTQPIIAPESSANTHIVISEIQIAGATANDEYIELYNPGGSAVELTGWSLKKKTGSGKEYALAAANRLEGKMIGAGKYLLLVNEEGYAGSISADVQWAKSNTLAAGNTILLYDAADAVIDKVGFGDAVDFETQAAADPESGQTLTRVANRDTDNNAADMQSQTPSPKNSLSGA